MLHTHTPITHNTYIKLFWWNKPKTDKSFRFAFAHTHTHSRRPIHYCTEMDSSFGLAALSIRHSEQRIWPFRQVDVMLNCCLPFGFVHCCALHHYTHSTHHHPTPVTTTIIKWWKHRQQCHRKYNKIVAERWNERTKPKKNWMDRRTKGDGRTRITRFLQSAEIMLSFFAFSSSLPLARTLARSVLERFLRRCFVTKLT